MVPIASIVVSICCQPNDPELPDRVTLIHRRICPPNGWDKADAFIAQAVTAARPCLDDAVANGQLFYLNLDVTWADAEGCVLEVPLHDPAAQGLVFNWSSCTLARQVRGFYLQLVDQTRAEACCQDYPDPETLLAFLRAHEVGG